MKILLLSALLLPGLTPALVLPSEQRTNGPLIREVFDPVQKYLQKYSAALYDGNQHALYATVVSADGLLLTKASELPAIKDLRVRIGREWYENPQILKTDVTWDVAFLKVEASDLTPAVWLPSSDLPQGTWVVSNGSTTRSERRVRAGIISANSRPIEGAIPVVLGLQLNTENAQRPRVMKVGKDSGAEKAGVEVGDLILKADNADVASMEDLYAVLMGKQPGQTVKLEIERGEKNLTLDIELMPRVAIFDEQRSRNDQMSGPISKRRDSFPRVLQHDTMLSQDAVGGPLLTLDGKCAGMNIACANRVESFAIPSEEVQQLVQSFLQETRE